MKCLNFPRKYIRCLNRPDFEPGVRIHTNAAFDSLARRTNNKERWHICPNLSSRDHNPQSGSSSRPLKKTQLCRNSFLHTAAGQVTLLRATATSRKRFENSAEMKMRRCLIVSSDPLLPSHVKRLAENVRHCFLFCFLVIHFSKT